jgi:hypothetical protein
MKLRLSLILFCLLCIGMFARSQDRKKASPKPTVENGADAIPVIVTSTKKAHSKPPPPPPKAVKDVPKPPPLPVNPVKPTASQPIPPTPPKKTGLL